MLTYYVSGRFAHENGILGGTQYGPAEDTDTQKQANANLTIFPTENLRVRLTSRYTNRRHTIPTNGNNTTGMFSMSIMTKPEFASENNALGWRAFATLQEAMQILVTEDVDRFGGSLTASYAVTPEFNLEVTAGLDHTNQTGTFFRRFGWNINDVSLYTPDGLRSITDRNNTDLTFEGRASWNAALGDQFTSSLVIGAQMLTGEEHISEAEGEQFPAPGLEVTDAGVFQSVDEFILKTVNAGVFAQEQIGFRDYLFLTAGARLDRHSAFGETAGGALYPKLGLSFVPSDMPGWSEIGPLSTLRLRGSIGQSGLQPGAFDKFTTFDPLGSEAGPGIDPDNLGNPDLKPEVTTEWEGGFEAGLLDNRVGVQATYWNRTTTDLLVERQFPPSGGFVQEQLDNIGEMMAWGLELGVNGTVYSGPDLTLNLFANTAYMHQEVTSLGGAPPIKVGYYRYRTWIKEGYAPGSFFGAKLADVPYPFDTNRDGQADSREEVLAWFSEARSPDDIPLFLAEHEDGPLGHYLGKPVPDWQGSFGGDITFLSNFTLSSLFSYKAGNFQIENLSGVFRRSHSALGRNTPKSARIESALVNPESTAEERLAAAQDWARYGASLAPYSGLNSIEDADYIRWRELSLTYRVPGELAARFGAESLSLTAGARNLALWTKYTGIDPEANVSPDDNFVFGIEGWRPGTPRRFTFSARVNF